MARKEPAAKPKPTADEILQLAEDIARQVRQTVPPSMRCVFKKAVESVLDIMDDVEPQDWEEDDE